jgi:hypothetical protein
MADLSPKPDGSNSTGSKFGILHPYFDLNDSLEVAKVVHDRGGGQCARDLVAAALGYSTTKSGAFLSRISAAKQFGLIRVGGDVVSTTDKAITILHPVMDSDATIGRRDAFLNVPLFQKVFDKFKGSSLPQEIGLQNFFKSEFKIPDDRLKPAVRVMLASAEQAGFFAAGGNTRLIAPGGVQTAIGKSEPAKVDLLEIHADRSKASIPVTSSESPPNVHPALIAMLRELPRSGTDWAPAKKDRFMAAFRSIVDVVYPDPEVTS